MKLFKKVILGVILFVCGSAIYAQDSIKVSKFELLERDIMASVQRVDDINGQACGIIKIETNDNDYVFEPNFGSIKEIQKMGERILYVPKGTKSISIRHPKYVMLRNYKLPEIVQSKTVYLLHLDIKKCDQTLYTDLEVLCNVEEGADVYIDDIFYGVTPFRQRVSYGNHYFVLRANRFQPAGKKINIEGAHQKFKFTLMKNKHFKYKSKSIPKD